MKTVIETIEGVIAQKKQDVKWAIEEKERIDNRINATRYEINCLNDDLEQLRDIDKHRNQSMIKCGSAMQGQGQ